jgi:uncharacterized membrane protein YciS (DUF1049 family)
MAEAFAQTYKNHAKFVPPYHFFVLPMLLVNVIWAAMRAFGSLSVDTVIALLTAVALMMVALFARVFALKVQDRVIRLEMRLRMRELLPAELQPRIKDFTTEQLIAMRFACDDELPELAATVLRDNPQDRKTIKQMVKQWTPDEARC